jgi:hypothetical protein
MAAMVFKTGLLTRADAADIGWSRVPLGSLHGKRSAGALDQSGVSVYPGVRVNSVVPRAEGGYSVQAGDSIDADGVVVALPPADAAGVLPGSVTPPGRWAELGTSGILDVHLVFDRPVSPWPMLAAVDSPIQWVFDRTASAGLSRGQYLALSVSAADRLLGERPEALVRRFHTELGRLLPKAAGAALVDSVVTKERQATFRAAPGSGRHRPGPRTRLSGLMLAGAWTDTGWPATMEGAVRSGRAAAQACLDDIRTGATSCPTKQEVA